MPVQFKTRTLLYLTACVGAWLTCTSAAASHWGVRIRDAFEFTLITSPVWLPLTVLAYALGSRRFTLKTFLAFIVAGPIGLGLSILYN